MHRRALHGTPELLGPRDVAHRHDDVRDRRPDVGAHDDGDRAFELEGAGGHQGHGQARGRRRALYDARGKQTREQRKQRRPRRGQ